MSRTKLGLICLSLCLVELASVHAVAADGIVRSIVNAPVTPDGNVRGAFTELVINLNVSMNPDIPGRSLMTGESIAIGFPNVFEVDPAVPTVPPFTAGCNPVAGFQCNTAILLQGWPQRPIGVPPPVPWTVSIGSTPTTIVLTATEDIVPNPPGSPGIKQIHLLLTGFTNPTPGRYPVRVAFRDGTGGEVANGSARAHIVPHARPSINVTSIDPDDAGNNGVNRIFQSTFVGEPTPLPYRFLLWARRGEPMTGVTLRDGRLVRGQRTVGHVRIEAPSGAVGQEVVSLGPSTGPIPAPVSGRPTAEFRAQFTAGSLPGWYVITLDLKGGKVRMFVHALEP